MITIMKELLTKWITALEKEVSLQQGLVAFNFGLFESEDGCYAIYLAGAESYDKDDEDWACDTAYQSQPLLLHDDRLSTMDWEEAQTAIADAIRELLSKDFKDSCFSKKIITIGFDDGNLSRLQ